MRAKPSKLRLKGLYLIIIIVVKTQDDRDGKSICNAHSYHIGFSIVSTTAKKINTGINQCLKLLKTPFINQIGSMHGVFVKVCVI